MKLNPDSKLASFYRYFYLTTDLPRSFCDYFWKLLLAFCMLPFTHLSLIINYSNKRIYKDVERGYYRYRGHPIPTFVSVFISILVWVVGLLSILIFYNGEYLDVTFFYVVIFPYLIGLVTTPTLILAVLGIFIAAYKGSEIYENFRYNKPKKRKSYNTSPNVFKMIKLQYNAIKEKNCPIIEWDDSEQKA